MSPVAGASCQGFDSRRRAAVPHTFSPAGGTCLPTALAALSSDREIAVRMSTIGHPRRFKRLITEEIAAYVDCREGEGKAGGYAIQGRAELSCASEWFLVERGRFAAAGDVPASKSGYR